MSRPSSPPSLVALAGGSGVSYPSEPPWSPSERYPEYPFGEMFPLSRENRVYSAFREGLRLLELDVEGYGSPRWNPLGGLIRPGDRVLLKPNAVLDRNLSGADPFAIVTHPSVIRAALDFAWIALEGRGTLVVADSPQFDSDFDAWMALTRMGDLRSFYLGAAGLDLEILDLRRMTARFDARKGIYPAGEVTLREGDPRGYAVIDLADGSLLSGLRNLERLYGADYDSAFTRAHHSGGRHEYCIARTVLESDVILSLPKLKTHRKVGVTLNIKGLVGINGDKNYLAHYRVGPPGRGGDEFPDEVAGLRKASRAAGRKMSGTLLAPRKPLPEALFLVFSRLRSAAGGLARRLGLLGPPGAADSIDCGDWAGNDTAWRMAADLLRIALLASPDGTLAGGRRRRFFSAVDGIVAGEGEGPLSASPRPEGVLVMGMDPVAVDVVATEYMGVPHLKVPMLRFFSEGGAPWAAYGGDDSIAVSTDAAGGRIPLSDVRSPGGPFRLPAGWGSIGSCKLP